LAETSGTDQFLDREILKNPGGRNSVPREAETCGWIFHLNPSRNSPTELRLQNGVGQRLPALISFLFFAFVALGGYEHDLDRVPKAAGSGA